MTDEDRARIWHALNLELGWQTCLHLQVQPRDMRWWRGLWSWRDGGA